jgi:hypothetical protein
VVIVGQWTSGLKKKLAGNTAPGVDITLVIVNLMGELTNSEVTTDVYLGLLPSNTNPAMVHSPHGLLYWYWRITPKIQ